ncbi:MAG: ABC transporter permease [Deferribacterales bacterium]|nr:ABC transporter permease [Deferribacterales bacterium]
MSEFLIKYGPLLVQGTLDTLYMTVVSTFFSYLFGVPAGVALSVTKSGGIAQSLRFNAVFGWVVNVARSIPFIILMIFVIPFTRFIAGTSIGATAANVPLIIAATPFVARVVEQSIEEVDRGVIEAAKCMGATNFQIIMKVLLVESAPGLLRGLSISAITILGYTAITGAVGAGGLGNLAFRFGYQRYQDDVMYSTVILLIILVCLIQWASNWAAAKSDKKIIK